MTKLIVFLIAAFSVYLFVSNDSVRNETIKEAKNIQDELSNTGGGNSKKETKIDPSKYTQEEIEYFREIAMNGEYSDFDNGHTVKWESDVNIYVQGEKIPELMDELDRIVSELNSIIDPININIVSNKEDANYIILFGSQYEYNRMEPISTKYTEDNWGMFVINSGKVIKEGTMYVDTDRCEDSRGRKHLLREELTQSLGLINDSYKYENSIFQQKWTETNEYAPIDIKMVEMLYNN